MNLMHIKTDLMTDEGLRLFPYTDPTGHLTIGYGRNLNKGITKAEALFLLDNDIAQAVHDLNGQLPWWTTLSDARQDVLVEMVFNLGIDRFFTFVHMLAALKSGDYSGAAVEMLNSKWASQVGARAERLAGVMRTGVEG